MIYIFLGVDKYINQFHLKCNYISHYNYYFGYLNILLPNY